MSNIIRFPVVRQKSLGRRVPHPRPEVAPEVKGKGFLAGLLTVVWLVTALLWPLLKWVMTLDVLFQFVRMLYYWSTPGMYAGWTFLLHFGAMSCLTYYVAFGDPKGPRC